MVVSSINARRMVPLLERAPLPTSIGLIGLARGSKRLHLRLRGAAAPPSTDDVVSNDKRALGSRHGRVAGLESEMRESRLSALGVVELIALLNQLPMRRK